MLTQVKADTVPQFYFPGGKPVASEVREQALAKIDDLFRSSPDGLAVPDVSEVVREVSNQTPPLQLQLTLSIIIVTPQHLVKRKSVCQLIAWQRVQCLQ